MNTEDEDARLPLAVEVFSLPLFLVPKASAPAPLSIILLDKEQLVEWFFDMSW